MPEQRNAFISLCIRPDDLPLIDFAAKERAQTRSSFVYGLICRELRTMGLLETPQPPAPKPNGDSAHAA